MDLPAIRTLHAYDAWANRRVVDTLGAGAPAKARRTFCHLVAASELWWSRFTGAPLRGWEPSPLWREDETRERLERIMVRWAGALATMDDGDLNRDLSFNDNRGMPQCDRIGDLLVHLAAHGTHHRGQVLTHLRGAGLTPPMIDYLIWYRERR